MTARETFPSFHRLSAASLAIAVFGAGLAGPSAAFAAPVPALSSEPAVSSPSGESLVDRLASVKERALMAEKALMLALEDEKLAKQRIVRLRELTALQTQEKALLEKRLKEIEVFLTELEGRSGKVRAHLEERQTKVRTFLQDLWLSQSEKLSLDDLAKESFEAARRKMLSDLADRAVQEVESLRADAMDASDLDRKIHVEKEQLAAAIQDIAEHESLLKANAELEKGLVHERHAERVAQFKQYRELRASERQLESVIRQFNARVELEEVRETERRVHREMARGGFALKQGSLPFPVAGRVSTAFGKGVDPETRLPVFRKGVEIAPMAARSPVQAIFSGKVVFSGVLPHYGQLVIIDHGGHFYSLCGGLKTLLKKTGDAVSAGESVGQSDDAGRPVYFEIRDRNVAVNPLQWISASL